MCKLFHPYELNFSAAEVLREATLTVAYSFENVSLLDDGPLGINGTGLNFGFDTSCRVNICVSLINSPSYIQAAGLVLLGTSRQAHSFALWIKPTVVNQGTIIHLSQNSTGLGWCFPLVGFTSSSAIHAQYWNGSSINRPGPTITANVWTHVATTYSTTNGLRLWINGVQYGTSTGAFSYTAPNAPIFVTIGSPINGQTCPSGAINQGEYSGYVDEFQLYSRELSSTNILNLANP